MTEKVTADLSTDAFLKALKSRTANRHAALEANALSVSLVSPSVTTETYKRYLSKMLGVMSAVEAKVFPVVDDIYPVSSRRKTDMIGNDLSQHGINEDMMPLPEMNMPKALGCMYVTEGSTLGGRYLYKHIQKALGMDRDSGASFFWGYGDDTGKMWKDFISFISTYAVEHNCGEEIIQSADDTFYRIDSWMSDK